MSTSPYTNLYAPARRQHGRIGGGGACHRPRVRERAGHVQQSGGPLDLLTALSKKTIFPFIITCGKPVKTWSYIYAFANELQDIRVA